MPLLDHFHVPLWPRRDWHSFHNGWATMIAGSLNASLPKDYFAEPNVQFGIEIDVAAFDEAGSDAVRIESPSWDPGPPRATIDLPLITDVVEVAVFHQRARRLVAAIELVSPSNKDRPRNQDAFVAKCASYVVQGVGLVVVDVVTERLANLHARLLERFDESAPGEPEGLYAASYRPGTRAGRHGLSIWYQPLAVDAPLPAMPLWLLEGPCLRVDLESTYEQTRQALRIGPSAAPAS